MRWHWYKRHCAEAVSAQQSADDASAERRSAEASGEAFRYWAVVGTPLRQQAHARATLKVRQRMGDRDQRHAETEQCRPAHRLGVIEHDRLFQCRRDLRAATRVVDAVKKTGRKPAVRRSSWRRSGRRSASQRGRLPRSCLGGQSRMQAAIGGILNAGAVQVSSLKWLDALGEMPCRAERVISLVPKAARTRANTSSGAQDTRQCWSV